MTEKSVFILNIPEFQLIVTAEYMAAVVDKGYCSLLVTIRRHIHVIVRMGKIHVVQLSYHL